jgi:lambda repressor-like predicted transcriptional regulator
MSKPPYKPRHDLKARIVATGTSLKTFSTKNKISYSYLTKAIAGWAAMSGMMEKKIEKGLAR